MKSRKVPFCENCDAPLVDSNDGFIVQGNIFAADAETAFGIIGGTGSLSPDPLTGQPPKVAYCRRCFCETLGLKEQRPR